MKFVILYTLMLASAFTKAQSDSSTQNIFIITTDGFRWQEVFNGADSGLINDHRFVADPALLKQLYWDPTVEGRRQKLLPFFWSTIAKQGQIYGNRDFRNNMNVTNLYKISYPGYNEMLTGYADPIFIPNIPIRNRNINVLEYLNSKKEFQGKVAAFSSWNIFTAILNKKRNGLPGNCGYEKLEDDSTLNRDVIIQSQEQIFNKKHTRYDLLTFLSAREYVEHFKPRVVLIGFGETDEFAHSRQYDMYLQQAANVDKMIAELWYYVQTDPFYKDKTTFIITTDHGRGSQTSAWYKHGILTKGSGETWFAVMGPGISPGGEIRTPLQIYQKQIASTISQLMGEDFQHEEHAAGPIQITNMSVYHPASFNAGIY